MPTGSARGSGESLGRDVRFAGRLAVLRDNLEAMVLVMENQLDVARAKTVEVQAHAAAAEEATGQAGRARKRDEARRLGMLGAGETLEGVADAIKTATADLRTEARQVASGAEEQRLHVDETAQAVDVMVASTAEVAQGAAKAALAADEARQRADNGASVVDRSVAAIGKVSTLSAALTANLSELGRQAESIGQVMTVISDIADQTNLLALNAAIEGGPGRRGRTRLRRGGRRGAQTGRKDHERHGRGGPGSSRPSSRAPSTTSATWTRRPRPWPRPPPLAGESGRPWARS